MCVNGSQRVEVPSDWCHDASSQRVVPCAAISVFAPSESSASRVRSRSASPRSWMTVMHSASSTARLFNQNSVSSLNGVQGGPNSALRQPVKLLVLVRAFTSSKRAAILMYRPRISMRLAFPCCLAGSYQPCRKDPTMGTSKITAANVCTFHSQEGSNPPFSFEGVSWFSSAQVGFNPLSPSRAPRPPPSLPHNSSKRSKCMRQSRAMLCSTPG
mmetsp:Transcript_36424/g.74771  ORF Transcript_36424/g.74771 Transcript_36424/m.74771 type:complete len:214 (-) Transcript_36424:648-1289(-)